MNLYRVTTNNGLVVHIAKARREDIAKMLAPEDATPDNWYHWRTVCGVELIGHRTIGYDANCTRCLKALEKAQQTVADIRERFGDGTVL